MFTDLQEFGVAWLHRAVCGVAMGPVANNPGYPANGRSVTMPPTTDHCYFQSLRTFVASAGAAPMSTAAPMSARTFSIAAIIPIVSSGST